MTVTCDNLDTLLLEGDPFSMETAARHAEGCEACAARLASWNDIADTARGLHAEWQSDTLWPRIDRAIRQEARHARMRLWQIAAAVVLMTGIGALAWVAHERTRASEFDQAILRSSALEQVEKAEQAHIAAIDQLETIATPKLDRADDPLLVSYREKLMLIDSAIAECQAGIDRNRQNAYLRKHLLTIYSEKQRTLEDVLREETHEANP